MNIKKQLIHGFTIVELLIVIAIIGILTTIVAVSYNGVQNNAIGVSLQSDLSNASDFLRIDQARSSTGSFPDTLALANGGRGIPLSSGTSYSTYVRNNSTLPHTFCLTATKSGQNYFITQEGTPMPGVCPILYLDAGIATSYPGNGTTWFDLSGNGRDGSLNGATHNSSDGGSFVFDGVNDTINLGTGNTFFPLPNFSMELWFKSNGTTPTTGTSPGLLGITYGIRLFVYSSSLQFSLDNGTSSPGMSTNGTYSFYDSSWHQVVIQANSTTRYIYVDGLLSNTLNAGWSGVTRWPTNVANVGRDNNNSMYYFNGNIAVVKFYDRVLSADDINKNFNVLRSRYGL